MEEGAADCGRRRAPQTTLGEHAELDSEVRGRAHTHLAEIWGGPKPEVFRLYATLRSTNI